MSTWPELIFYGQVRASLLQAGLVDELYVASGSLLGIVRDDGPIKDDDDFDAAYVLPTDSVHAIRESLVAVAVYLNSQGFDAHVSTPMNTHLHVHHVTDYAKRIDIFVNYLEGELLRVPAGIATSVTEFVWSGTHTYPHKNVEIAAPEEVEEYLSFYYGHDWQVPKTGSLWDWRAECKRSWRAMSLTDGQVSKVEKTRPNLGPRPDCEKA